MQIEIEFPGDANGRICLGCKEWKTWENFSPHLKHGTGRHPRCKPCRAEQQRAQYHRDPETKAKWLAENRRRRADKLKWLYDLKSAPCIDCGQRFAPWVMQFDHVKTGKVAAVATLLTNGKSKEEILAEIEKCELVCSNCHSDRTFRRSNSMTTMGFVELFKTVPS